MPPADLVRTLRGYTRFPSHLHGPAHWARVRRFGTLLAEREGLPADAQACVEVFAWVHDLAREDDGGGNQHAIDGASHVDVVVPAVFGELRPEQIEIVRVAVRYHSDGLVARQALAVGLLEGLDGPSDLVARTIGCCWDADRLDLPRVGIHPRPEFMSTASWREVLAQSLRIHEQGRTDIR